MNKSAGALGRRAFMRSITGMAALASAGRMAAAAEPPARGATSQVGKHTAEFTVRAAGLEGPEGPVVMPDGSVLVCEMFKGRLSRLQPDGKMVPLPTLGGAPNGAAIGPDGACYVTNNGGFNTTRDASGKMRLPSGPSGSQKGGSIQRLDLAGGAVRTLYTEANGKTLRSPNDLVFDASGGFYFTDLGKLGEDYMEMGAVYWARADGGEIRRVVERLLTPNGIALSPDQRTLYVALTQTRQVVAYDIVSPGRLATDEKGTVRQRLLVSLGGDLTFDSMKVEANGNLLVGTLTAGCVSVFSAGGALLDQQYLPDSNVTNMAFAGSDLRTLYVTLTNSGRLVTMSWPRPGLRLQYQKG